MDKNKKMLPLNLQFFADGGEKSEGTDEATSANNENEENNSTTKVEKKVENAQKAEKTEKLFTQAQVDELIKERLKRSTSKQSSQKADDKQSEEIEALRKELDALKQDNVKTKGERYALKQGVSEEKLDKVLKLASLEDEEDIVKAIDNVLKEFDVFKVNSKAKVTTGNAGGNGSKENEPNSLQEALSAMYNSKK